MRFVGLDLGGVNSLACVRDEGGAESFHGSAFPHRPSVVLLPMVRKERLLAGDEALKSERGAGLDWPPISRAAQVGWNCAVPPADGGRVLLASVWRGLVEDGRRSEPQWQPPDGLPPMNKPAPADCLFAEVRSVLARAVGGDNTGGVVLAIPNQLPEESQDALLTRLSSGAHLVWRAVAAAMAWAEDNAARITVDTQLAVLDAGLHGIEVSVFEFRRQDATGRAFHMPIRRPTGLRVVETGSLLAGTPAPFTAVRFDARRIEDHLSEISEVIIRPQITHLLCGPFGGAVAGILDRRFPRILWPVPDARAIARGSALFAFRLANDLPSYLDVLPSLELFITNRYREPEWHSVIPADLEVAGGQEYVQEFERILAVRAGTGELESWLRRSHEQELRKLTTILARVAASEVPVDLRIAARSAGGFARLEVSPSDGQNEVFGESRRLLLDWLNMKRENGTPTGFPPGTKFGWPEAGELFGHRPAFQDFLHYGVLYCTNGDIGSLSMLESVATKPTPVPSLDQPEHRTGVESGTIPVRSLPCFGSAALCRFFEGGTPNKREMEILERVRVALWYQLNRLRHSNVASNRKRTRLLIRILGRMGLHSPSGFAEYLAESLKPRMDSNTLFAIGRVFCSALHAKLFFEAVRQKADMGHPISAPWLRTLDYLLFQRPNILESTDRKDLDAAMGLTLASFKAELEARKFKVKFGLSVRAIARLLRARRHYPTFIQRSSEIALERSLAICIEEALNECLRILPTARDVEGILRNRHARLCELTKEWLLTTARTNVFGPPEEDGVEDENGRETL